MLRQALHRTADSEMPFFLEDFFCGLFFNKKTDKSTFCVHQIVQLFIGSFPLPIHQKWESR